MEKNEHVYYWAWKEEDNPDHKYFSPEMPKWYRVFRLGKTLKDTPITEPMSRAEAITYCERIVKLTGGGEL
jgi:hypothetical protein